MKTTQQKEVRSEFYKVCKSKFHRLDLYTLEDIVKDWSIIKHIKDANIDTIKHFVEHPQLEFQCLEYDARGLSDGYHRLVAMMIVGQHKLFYKYKKESMIGETKVKPRDIRIISVN